MPTYVDRMGRRLHYDYDYPFMANDTWIVIFDDTSPHYRNIQPGTVYYSPQFQQEYRIVDHADLARGYIIQWIREEDNEISALEDNFLEYEENYPSSDNIRHFSEEKEETDVSDIAPVIAAFGRNVPLVSFEQEFSGNGEAVSERLFDAGLCSTPYVNSYHNAEARWETSDSICYVETDSSCGYELIFDRLNLKNRRVAEQVAESQVILRDLKREGFVKLTAACGFHVHVDVSEWTMREIVSAYHLWNYIEDPIFRYASAFWSTHRDEETGREYSLPLRKGLVRKGEIGRRLSQRRDALNFGPILNAKAECGCGAIMYEDWANCTCNLRQPTLEFRVFNATANLRKIRSYLAFCVAFVNAAKTKEYTPESYPEMVYMGFDAPENVGEWEEMTQERMKFILNEFPLTLMEKSDFMYCARNSTLEPVLEKL